jgi:Serine/Threonine/Tyrosine Kinase found in polyvalent proteins
LQNSIKDDLQNVLSGKSEVRFGAIIQSIANYLDIGPSASQQIEDTKHFKRQEAKRLELFISKNDLWQEIDFRLYVSEGAEQRVYLKDSEHVLKLNDSIYYKTWRDYFLNLLLHNYFFPDTAYNLRGFTLKDQILYAVVEQSFVILTEPTDLNLVKAFLQHNGFRNTRNNDYFNEELGIILEDLHDENVLTRNGLLYFIDTVFYITDRFKDEVNSSL